MAGRGFAGTDGVGVGMEERGDFDDGWLKEVKSPQKRLKTRKAFERGVLSMRRERTDVYSVQHCSKMFVRRIDIWLGFGNRRAFVCVGRDWKIVCRIWNKLHIERVWPTNGCAYVVWVHWLLQKIFHILGKDDDDWSEQVSEFGGNFLIQSQSSNWNWNTDDRRKVKKPKDEGKMWLSSIIVMKKDEWNRLTVQCLLVSDLLSLAHSLFSAIAGATCQIQSSKLGRMW